MGRERYLDIAKGWGILWIVFLHFSDKSYLGSFRVFVGLYMITIFFVVAGWIDAMRPRPITFKELVRKRWKQLGVPYTYWTAIILIFDIVLCGVGYYDFNYIGKEAYKSIVLCGIGTLWFLPALFGGELLWHYTKRNNSVIIYLLMLVVCLSYKQLFDYMFDKNINNTDKIIEVPLMTISKMATAWICIAAGYMFGNLYRRYSQHLTKAHIFVISIVTLLASYWTTYNWYLPIGYELMTPIIAPIGFILLAKVFEDSRLLNNLDFWGKHSLGLMVTHYSIIMVICILLYNCITNSNEVRLVGWSSLLFFIVAMIVEYHLVLFIEKQFPKTLGK